MPKPIKIQILDEPFSIETGDSVLRALQSFGVDRGLPDYGFRRFCWNARCHQCELRFACAGISRTGLACQTEVSVGLHVETLPAVLRWESKLQSKA